MTTTTTARIPGIVPGDTIKRVAAHASAETTTRVNIAPLTAFLLLEDAGKMLLEGGENVLLLEGDKGVVVMSTRRVAEVVA